MSYDGSIKIKTDISTDEASSQLLSLENRIQRTSDKIASLRKKMDSLKGAKIPTAEYTEIQNQIDKASTKFDKLYEKQEALMSQGITSGTKWDALQYQMEELGHEIEYAKGELKDLVGTGKAFTLGSATPEFKKLSAEITYAENDMSALVRKHDELTNKQEKASTGAKKIGNSYRSAGSHGESGLKKIMHGLKRLTLLSVGVASVAALVNKVKSELSDSFDGYYNYSKSYRQTMDNFIASSSKMKNSLTSALAPAVETVMPYVVKLMDYITACANEISRFFAILSGKKTYTVGIASETSKNIGKTSDAVSDIGDDADNATESVKKLQGQLAGFDEMEVLDFSKNGLSSGKKGKKEKGGVSGSEASAPMFKEVALDGFDLSDMKDLGETLNHKLLNVLKNINWTKAYEGARNFGKGLANFLNGLISPELFYEVGKTIAGCLNTVLYAALSFAETFDWSNLGISIASSINGFFQNYDFKSLGKAVNTFMNGLLAALLGFADTLDWGSIFKAFYDFFSQIEIKNIALIIGAVVIKKVGKIVFTALVNAIVSGLKNSLVGIGSTVWEALSTDIGTTLAAGSAASIGTTIVLGIIGSVGAAIGGFHLGKKLGELVATAVGDMESVQYYRDFHWFGEGGFFPTIGEEIGYFIDDMQESFVQAKINAANLAGDIRRAVKEKWDDLRTDIKGANQLIATDVVTKFGEIKANTGLKVDETVVTMKTKWGNVKKTVLDTIDLLKTDADSKFSSMRRSLGGIVENTKNDINGWFDRARKDVSGESGILSKFKDSAVDKMGQIRDALRSPMNEIRNILQDPFTSLENMFRKPFNALLSGLETLINGVITGVNTCTKALNKLSFKAPDWVPGYGGKSWGFDIKQLSKISLPRLATGMVVPANYGEFAAILGDNRKETEVVSPLSTMKQAMLEAISESGMAGSGKFTIEATGDLAPLIRLLNLEIKKEQKRLGRDMGDIVYG